MSEYIERERALEILNDIGGCGAEPESYTAGWDEAINAAYEAIQSEPAADVAPVVHAHWIEDSNEYYALCYSRGQTPEQTEYLTESDVACSACLRKFNVTDNSFTHECANYCPNCGAKMDGRGKK